MSRELGAGSKYPVSTKDIGICKLSKKRNDGMSFRAKEWTLIQVHDKLATQTRKKFIAHNFFRAAGPSDRLFFTTDM